MLKQTSHSISRFRKVLFAVAALAVWLTGEASTDLMTVRNLDELIQSGQAGELAATAYVQGAVDGLLAMDALLEKEDGKKPEFCGFFEQARQSPIEHPAKKTKRLVQMWKKSGQSMDTLAVDMLIMHLTARFACE